ncbi:MAG: mercuric reductase [Alphaproteobacteria bacterium]|nr:mercuric reductase [Alphaproteobacteria bacterium]
MALAASGAAAAFGAASCCAIPMLLGGIGLGGLGSAIFMPVLAPYQSYLIAAAAVCLVAGGGLLWWRNACACRDARALTAVTLIGLVLGAALLVLGLSYG